MARWTRSANVALRVACAALVLAAGGCRARPEVQHPEPHRFLQQTTSGCDFSTSNLGFNPDVASDIYSSSLGFMLVHPGPAVACLNKILVGYDFAYQSVVNLGKIFNSSYVFAAMAANPTDGVALSLTVFNNSVDVPGELTKLARSWPVGKPVGLATLQFAVNQIFLRLRDAHVTYGGLSSDGVSGTILGDALRNATRTSVGEGDSRLYLLDLQTGEFMVWLEVVKQGKDYVLSAQFRSASGDYYWRTFSSINGKSPMDWFVSLADSPLLPLQYKPLGTRFNQMLNNWEYFSMSDVGDVRRLPTATVEYTDGSSSRLVWGVTFTPTVSASRLARLQVDANTIGVPLKALQKAAQAYEDVEQVAVAQARPLSPPAARHDPVTSRRRRLQDARALTQRVTWLNNTDDKGTAFGFYYFNKTQAVLKLRTFNYDYNLEWWPDFVADAKAAGATELVLDLTGNGGGYIFNGITVLLGLYPMAKYGDLGLRYDRILGEDAVFAYANQLRPKDLKVVLRDLETSPVYTKNQVTFIQSNRTQLQRLIRETRAITAALNALFASASKGQQQSCQGNSCREEWPSVARRITSVLTSISSGGLTTQGFKDLVYKHLPEVLELFWPYTGAPGDKGSDPYASPRLIRRGGKSRNYTALFDVNGYSVDDDVESFIFGLPRNYTAPFRKILAVSDGYCGSTCDTFSRTAWFYSRRNPTAPVFKFLTFGGTGNQRDSSPTAYPGGNVNSNDFLTASWAYAIMGQLLAEWTGWQKLYDDAGDWARLLPTFPAFLDNFTPQYTQSEVYNVGALGSESLPMEYVRVPTDYYAPVWYTLTYVPRTPTSRSDLPALYTTALSVLASMPGPRRAAATNTG